MSLMKNFDTQPPQVPLKSHQRGLHPNGLQGHTLPYKQDEQLSKIQASITAVCSPIANLWSELDAQNMKRLKSELVPADVVLQASPNLIGKATNYASTLSRESTFTYKS